MSTRLPKLTCGLALLFAVFCASPGVWAQGPVSSQQAVTEPAAEAAGEVPIDGQQASQIVRNSLKALEQLRSITARLRFQVHVLGFDMFGNGIFAQGPIDEHRYRFELQMRVEDPKQKKVEEQTSILLHVCDGDHLWMHQHLPDQEEPSVSKIDVDATYFGLASRRRADGFGDFPRTPALGGLARTVRELDAAFEFVEARATRLGDLDVWAIRGQWDATRLAKLVPEGSLETLPPQLPEYIVIYIGRDDSIPYRFDYYRRGSGRDANTPMMTLELYEVRLNGPLDAKQFTYLPGELPVQDATASFQLQLDVSPVE